VDNPNSWVTTIASGHGTSNITYSVAANPDPVERTNVLLIGNPTLGAPAAFTIVQHAVNCDYSVSPRGTSRGYGAATGVVSLTTGPTCPWTIEITNSWISIAPPLDGVGTTTNVTYMLDANPAAIQRVGYVTVVGVLTNVSFVITQQAALCNFSIKPSGRTHGHGAVTAAVDVTVAEGCPFTVINTNPWVSIVEINGIPLSNSGPSTNAASGKGSVKYALQANATGIERSGVITIDGLSFTVAQLAVDCDYTLSASGASHGSGVENGSIGVNTTSICQWDVFNTNGWITILTGASGTGNGTVTYSVSSNLVLAPRSGVLTIAGENFTVSQAAFTCSYKCVPDDRTNGHGATIGTAVAINAAAGCVWNITKTND